VRHVQQFESSVLDHGQTFRISMCSLIISALLNDIYVVHDHQAGIIDALLWRYIEILEDSIQGSLVQFTIIGFISFHTEYCLMTAKQTDVTLEKGQSTAGHSPDVDKEDDTDCSVVEYQWVSVALG
jgi:hypothetical protein